VTVVLLLLLAKWLHILAVIAVVGLHATYGVWIVRASHDTRALSFALRTIRALDNWLGLPGFVTMLVSGITMLALTRTLPTAPWLLTALMLFLSLVLTHAFVYRPTLRQLSRVVETEGAGAIAVHAHAARERNVGIAMTVVMVCIAFLMVIKPRLWG
jgi:uncharacterized membrane protein